jgi:oligoendopeptidase F
MPTESVPPRAQIPEKYKWNAASLFLTPADWQAEFENVASMLEPLAAYQGRLGESPELLLEAIQLVEDCLKRLGWVLAYVYLDYHVDTSDQAAARRYAQAVGLNGRVQAEVAFLQPELLELGFVRLENWQATEPRLQTYRHYFEDIFRMQAHIRSAEVEELLGMLNDPFQGAETTFSMLANSDLQFPPARDTQGNQLPVTDGTLGKLLSNPDREARRTAWEGYNDTYLAFKNTFSSNLTTSLKQDVFKARARRHSSSLEAALFKHNIPVQVFHNLIDVFRQNLPTWHRYWSIRRRLLGVEMLGPYDIWAPLVTPKSQVSFEQAVEWISAGLAPMGPNYVDALRKGCLEQRWVDVYPNLGKVAGAFSAGRPGTHPFIVMNYTGSLNSMSTLAHELGHSMHSYLAWQNQPILYSHYSLFVAEVASNFHQAMVRAYLLEQNSDPAFQISLIEEAMSNFHRYFFIMPTLARFELETHSRIERGEGLSADIMNEILADYFAEGYGQELDFDRERTGVTWATFPHLFESYYVFQYATGISGAHALANHILAGHPRAVENYLGFLKAGASAYPLEILKQAGVDLSTPAPVQETFRILASYVDRLEELAKNIQSLPTK